MIHKWGRTNSGSHSIRTLYFVIYSIYSDYSQNSLQQHSKTQGVVLKAQSVKSEEAILETGSMFDLVYRTNTLYPRPIFNWSSLNQSKVLAWKTSIRHNKTGALSAWSMASSRALPMKEFSKPCKTFEGDMLTKKPAANIHVWQNKLFLKRIVSRIFKPCRSWAQRCTKKL